MISKIMLICKKDNHYCEEAVNFIKTHFDSVLIVRVARGERFPEICKQWSGEFIISYLSPFVIPENILKKASIAAINFHPGPPEYPGIGCTNFAIYNEENSYGVTCHHMDKNVDTGKVIWVKRFPIHINESVYSLTKRSYTHIQELFYQLMDSLIRQKTLPRSNEVWLRRPYTRKELNELAVVTDVMSEREVSRRIRAMKYPGAQGAYKIKNGNRIALS
jgi:methionyl-tRNA formyltransferase